MDLLQRLQQALAPRYTIERELGRGGWSVVFLGYDPKFDRPVAVKVLRPELSATLAHRRFLNEIRLTAKFNHPYILTLLDSGEADHDLLFYVMPAEEGSLRDRLGKDEPLPPTDERLPSTDAPLPSTDAPLPSKGERRSPKRERLPLKEALRIAGEVAEALEYAHRHGEIHRDIKPENILFKAGHAVVSDFGIARAIVEAEEARVTGTDVVIGTPEYMSPEQARRAPLDERTDLYSLGVTLYESLTGHRPSLDVPLATRTLERVRADVSPAVLDILRRTIATEPADRYATAGELVKALAAARERRFWERTVPRVAAAALVILGGLWAWRAAVADRGSLDPNKVVVFPLVDRSGSGEGEDVASLIGSALEHTEPLRWIDGWAWLDAGQRADLTLLTAGAARRIARERGSRYYIDGSIVKRMASTTVILRLYDVDGDSLVAQESAAGSLPGLPAAQLGLRAVNRVLPRLLEPGGQVDLTVLTDRQPAAVAIWLQGEREYRRSLFDSALGYYRRAVAADSALALAALHGAQAAGWISRFSEAEALISAVLQRRSTLPTRHMHLARGLEAFLAGQADLAVRWLSQAITENPEWSEAHMALGEVFYHLFSAIPLSADSAAEASFLTASRLDEEFSPPLFHLAEIAIRLNELDRADQLIDRFAEFSPGSEQIRYLTLMYECVREGSGGFRDAAATPLQILTAAHSLSVGALQPACAEVGFRALLMREESPSYRWGALVGLQGALVAQGRDDEVNQLLDSAVSAGTGYANILYFIDALAGARTNEKAAAAAAAVRQRVGPNYEHVTSPEQLWILGAWHAAQGDSAMLNTLHRALTTLAARSNDRKASLFGRALAAHLAVARGDTAGAIAALRQLAPTAPRDSLDWSISEPLPVERLLLARLLVARGQAEEAYRVAAAFDHPTPVIYPPFVPASLVVRYRAAAALGNAELAHLSRQRLMRLGRHDLLSAVH